MGVEASQRRPHVLAVGAEGIALPRSGRGRAGQELLAHRLGRHGAVALEMGDVARVRREQGTVGDDHADLESDRRRPLLGAQHRIDQRVRHHGGVAAAVPRGAATLRLAAEAAVDLLGVESGEPRREGRHPVLTGGHRDVAVPARPAVAQRRTLRVELPGDGRDRVPPPAGARAVELGEPLAEDPIDLAGQVRLQHGGGVGDGVGGVPSDLSRGQRRHDPREGLDETTGRGEGAAGHVRGAAGDQGDVGDGGAVGLLLDAAARGGGGILVGGIVARLLPALAARGLLQGDHGAGLEGVERPAGGLDRAEQVGELSARPALGREQLCGVAGEPLEEERQVTEVLGEADGVRAAQRGEDLLGGVLPRGAREPRCARHASMLPAPVPEGQAGAGDGDGEAVWRNGRR